MLRRVVVIGLSICGLGVAASSRPAPGPPPAVAVGAVQPVGQLHHTRPDPGPTYGELSRRLVSADLVFDKSVVIAVADNGRSNVVLRQGALSERQFAIDPPANRGAEWTGVEAYIRATGRPHHAAAADLISLGARFVDGYTVAVERGTVSLQPESRLSAPAPDKVTGVTFETPAFVAALYERTGKRAGLVAWFERGQRLEWSFPGRTQGALSAENIERYENGRLVRGWPFKPDFGWAAIQAYGFAMLYSETASWNQRLAQVNGSAGVCSPGGGRRGVLGSIWNLFEHPLYANDPGCDRLHWLDGSVFRRCCDVHDLCYETFGCSERSWWTWSQGWSCVACNANAVVCFSKGGLCTVCAY